jgi:hypothetical protein
MNICIVAGYAGFGLFREYIIDLLKSSLEGTADVRVRLIEDIEQEVGTTNTLYIIVCQPEVYSTRAWTLRGNGNRTLLWCFEVCTPNTNAKGSRRFDIVCELLKNKQLDQLGVYDYHQYKSFGGLDGVIYLPTGYCDGMFPLNKGMYYDRLLFYGNLNTRRDIIMSVVLLSTKNKIVKSELKTTAEDIWETRKNEIARYLYSIDIPSESFVSNCTSISRITTLMSCGVVLLSHNDLGDLGFRDGVEYILYDTEEKAARSLDMLYE